MNDSDARRGMILFAVLWAVAFCAVLAIATSMTFRGLAGVVALDRDRAQADALLNAGLEAAAGIVATVGDAPLMERETTITLSTGSVRVHVTDEGGRIDVGKAPLELLASLLRHVGADDDDAGLVAKRIVDLRQPDRAATPSKVPQQPGAPPQPNTPQQRPAGKPDTPEAQVAVAPFTDVRQLINVPGMRPEWLTAMTPLITVYGNETVNPFTAPAAVIGALPSLDETRLDLFLTMRQSPMADPERLAFVLGAAQKYLKVKPKQAVSVDLTARTTDGLATAAQAFIVVLAGDKQPYRVLAWNPRPASAGIDAMR